MGAPLMSLPLVMEDRRLVARPFASMKCGGGRRLNAAGRSTADGVDQRASTASPFDPKRESKSRDLLRCHECASRAGMADEPWDSVCSLEVSFPYPGLGPNLVRRRGLQPVIDHTMGGAVSSNGREHLCVYLFAALYVEARLRATGLAALAEEPAVGIHDRPCEVLSHEIRGILSS